MRFAPHFSFECLYSLLCLRNISFSQNETDFAEQQNLNKHFLRFIRASSKIHQNVISLKQKLVKEIEFSFHSL